QLAPAVQTPPSEASRFMLGGGGGMAPGVGGRLPPAGIGACIPRRPASAGTLPTAVRAALSTSSFGSVGNPAGRTVVRTGEWVTASSRAAHRSGETSAPSALPAASL